MKQEDREALERERFIDAFEEELWLSFNSFYWDGGKKDDAAYAEAKRLTEMLRKGLL